MKRRWTREHTLPLLESLPCHLFSSPLILWFFFLKHSSNVLMVYWTIKLPENWQNWNVAFFTTGHFLLLNPSPAEKDAGICKYHLTSPVLPGSDKQCVFQLALYEAARASGNITLLIKAVLSGSTVRSLSLNRTSRDDHRLAITEIVQNCAEHGTVSVYLQ